MNPECTQVPPAVPEAPPLLDPWKTVTLRNLKLALIGLNIGREFRFIGEVSGPQYRTFEFLQDGKKCIAVRIRLPTYEFPQDISSRVQHEWNMLKKLEACNFRHSPICLGGSVSCENPLMWPFLVLEWPLGKPMEWSHTTPESYVRTQFLEELQVIQLQLIACTLDTNQLTAKEYCSSWINMRMVQAYPGQPAGWPTKDDYGTQLDNLDRVLGNDCGNTLYAVYHPDLRPGNVIVGDEFSIECILDWSEAMIAPICYAAALPRFLGPEITDGDCPPSSGMKRDRAEYTSALGRHDMVLTPTTDAMRRWQYGTDGPFRALFIMSLLNNEALWYLSRRGWAPVHYPFIGCGPPSSTPLRPAVAAAKTVRRKKKKKPEVEGEGSGS